ncbi:AAA family ATPase [Burkholderia gladioli]|uniref:AAA family ATPase n=1 Tax=Burkholderia gladioli TaxID=28095 RepID=UPI00163FB782|nr:ATP-binding protein [Burkholderia gladioli]
MRRLVVKNFSCIKSATLDLAPLTAIIGPQSSGKSVLLKLTYFFTDFFVNSVELVKEGLSSQAAKKRVLENFQEWFPASAWGGDRFSIEFNLGDFKIRLLRKSSRGQLLDTASVKFSEDFEAFINEASDLFSEIEAPDTDKSTVAEYNSLRRLGAAAAKVLSASLGENYVANQIFIPAGRSFFTGPGKALLAFEHGGLIDFVTAEFGRRYASARARINRRPIVNNYAESVFQEMLGGKVVLEGGKEYLRAADGRVLPFNALSSGQQEILPLVLILQTLAPFSNIPNGAAVGGPPSRRIMYIEEPEAHLFPHAQNNLVQLLCALVRLRTKTQDLLVTTHSPYVLAKINNMIKAGAIEKKFGGAVIGKLDEILKIKCALRPGTVNAYAIIDGILTDIVDDSGLIDADYLDEVSGEIGEEFDRLLDIERGHG